MATAKRTTFAGTGNTLKALEAAVTTARQDGAPDDAAIWFFPTGDGYTLKAEWSVEVPDPAEPAPDERPQPTTYATGGVIGGPVPVILHEGEALVQPDGLVNESPAH